MLFSASKLLAQDANTFNILFKSNKSTLPDSARFQLIKKVYTINPEQINIVGHCDSIGSIPANETLSKRRALAVKKVLTDNGIADKDIKMCIGYGEAKPIAGNMSEIDRQLNRRVEVQFIGQKKPQEPTVATKPIAKPVETKPAIKKIEKAALEVGKKIVLENLLFIPGMHHLLESSIDVLENLYEVLAENETMIIQIQGHVCCTYDGIMDGTDIQYGTNDLSTTRAREIYDQLIRRGIAPSRLKYEGFGGTRKISKTENTEEEKAANRRVEILIISK